MTVVASVNHSIVFSNPTSNNEHKEKVQLLLDNLKSLGRSMSHSLSPPWIYPSIVSIFTDQPDEDLDVYQSSQRFSCPPKTVHVIGYNTKLRALRVSDTKHSMYVFLTLYGFNEITKEISFPEINHCIIKLRHYHVSTVVQASGIRDPEDLRAITFPLVINCSSVQYLGGNGGLDLQRQDEIHDINTVIKQQLLNNISYVKLYEKLLKSQFPDEKYLPDAGTYMNFIAVVNVIYLLSKREYFVIFPCLTNQILWMRMIV